MASALSRVKTTKFFFWYYESVRNSVIAGVISSQTSTAFAGHLQPRSRHPRDEKIPGNEVGGSECSAVSARRELNSVYLQPLS